MIEVAAIGLRETIATIKEAQRQVPYASARACNDTALQVQRWTISERLPEAFTLRARGAPWWKPGTRLGFNIKFANKANPEAVLGTQADWMKIQETGGTKQAHGHRLAIPTPAWKARTEMMIASKKPRVLRQAMESAGKTALNDANARVAHLGRTIARVRAAEAHARTKASARSGMSKAERKRQADIAKALRVKRHALTSAERKAHRERLGIARRRDTTSALLGSIGNTPFMAKLKSGHEAMFVRLGPARLPIRKLFTFVSAARLNTEFGWEKAASIVASLAYPGHFAKRWAEAMRDRL